MGNVKETFDQYQQMTQNANAEREQQHAQNADPQSHASFFANKKPKTLVIADDEKAEDVTPEAAKRSIQKQAQVSKMVEDALVNRVEPPTGVDCMKIGWEEFKNIRNDPNFESFAKYAQHITHYTNGNERPQPLRPFVKNEVGMYRGRIVVLDKMPDQGRGDVPYVQVPAKIEAVSVEPDPFPSKPASSEPFTVIKGEKKD